MTLSFAMRVWQRPFGPLLLALLGLVALVYWPGLHGGYVFDDFPNIVDNTTLHVNSQSGWLDWLAATFSSPASDLQRPLAMLSFAANHALTGLDPYWMKITNLVIHLLNTGLVFGLSRCLLNLITSRSEEAGTNPSNWVALWIAAAWALNPINLMAVLFVVQRMESLSHTFVFAGLWLYLVGRERLLVGGHGWVPLLGGLVGGAGLGVLAKESAVLLPVYALALEWAFLGFASHAQVRDRRLLAVFCGVLLLPGVTGLVWLLPRALEAGAYAGRNFGLGERLLTEARVVIDYAHWTLLPNLNQLSLYHDDYQVSRGLLSPPGTLVAMLLLAATVGTMAWFRKRRPLLALGLAWFLCAHLLTATVIPLELAFEHRNYFASLGLCLVLADVLLHAPRSHSLRRVGMATAMMLLALYAGLTALRAREWSNQLRFGLAEAIKHPLSPRATYDLARNFIILSDYQPGSPYLARAFTTLEQARRAPGATILPETAAIVLASRTGLPIQRDWWTSLQHKLRTQPLGPQAEGAMAALVKCQLQFDCPLPEQDMIDSLNAGLSQNAGPEFLSIYGNYALNVLRDPNIAIKLWQQAATRAPNVVQYQVSMARIWMASGRADLAKPYVEKVRQLGRLGQNEALAEELERLGTGEDPVRRAPDEASDR